MTWIESIAVVFGLISVWLTIRQNIWCWPTGLVQVILFTIIFLEVKLYSDVILHVIYIFLQLYGWHYWLRGGKNHGPVVVSRLTRRGFAGWISIAIVCTMLWGWGMARFTDAALPFWDAYIAVASLIAQWLMTRKRLESWLFWISVDVVAIGVYLQKSLILTSALYSVFLILAIKGFFAWRASMQSVFDEDRSDTRQIRPAA